MAMQINGNYDYSRTNYAEKVKEKQSTERAEKAKEAGKLSEPQDEYISSEKSEKEPTGLYQVRQDENGNRKIFFDDPKAVHATGKEKPKADNDCSKKSADGKEPEIGGNNSGKPTEKCITNTDKVDREIKKLKEKKQQLEQSLSTSGDEKKIWELEKKLTQVENELIQKDNDTYRRQHASIIRVKWI